MATNEVEVARAKKRGGNHKIPPPGYYSASQAMAKLGMNKSTFIGYVNDGKIPRTVPPLHKNGFYPQAEIDRLATETTIFFLTTHARSEYEPSVFRVATSADIPGIYSVIAKLWGPGKTTPQSLRARWYAKNPQIDYIVLQHGVVMGYLNAMPLTSEALEGMMSGRLRGWDIKPEDLREYEPGQVYDLFVGIATRPDVPHSQRYGARLLLGFFDALIALAAQGVKVRRLYAVSDQPDGIKLCEGLGFVQEERQEGDLFGRYVLDLEDAPSPIARRYREQVEAADIPSPPLTRSRVSEMRQLLSEADHLLDYDHDEERKDAIAAWRRRVARFKV